MKTVPAVIRLYLTETRNSVIVFLSVLLAIYIATFAMLVYFAGGTTNFGGIMSVYIFCFVIAILMLSEPLSFLLGMNIRRIDFFKATMAYFAILATFFSICITILSIVERSLNSLFSIQLYFFSQAFNQSIVYEFFTHLLTIFLFMSFGFFIASVHYRTGKLGVFLLFAFTLFVAIFAGVILGISLEPLLNAPWKIAVIGVVAVLIFVGLSYLLIRKAQAKIFN